jgi:hypothetical protein
MLAFKARFYGSLANFPLNETYLPIPSNWGPVRGDSFLICKTSKIIS